MKSKNKASLVFWVVFFIVALIIVLLSAFLSDKDTAEPDYSYYITRYDVQYEYKEGRTFAVSESITVVFRDTGKHGIIRDLPVNSGEIYSHIRSEDAFDVKKESDYISVYLGDEDRTLPVATEISYEITYDFKIPAPDGKDSLYINLIGGGWATTIQNATCTLILPAAPENLLVNDADFGGSHSVEGNVVTVVGEDLAPFSPVTVGLDLPAGSMGAFAPDGGEIAAVVIAALLLVAVVLFGILSPKVDPTPVVTFTPPEGVDPLLAGTLIDGSVQNEDITSLIYYWANKKLLTVDFTDEEDPILHKIGELPPEAPDHERVVFERIFLGGDTVAISSLNNTFYVTAAQAKRLAVSKTPKMFTRRSCLFSGIFAIAAALLFCLTIFLRGMRINTSFQLIVPLIPVLLFAVIYAIGYLSVKNKRKISSRKRILLFVAQLAVAGAFTAVACFLILPTYLFTLVKPFFCILAALTAVASPYLLRERSEYISAVNALLGFQEFIRLAEKDRLEMLLKENPEYYYDILPYAQVLGVSDIWEEKFKDLDMQPPTWATAPNATLLNFIVLSAVMRNATRNMAHTFVSRPAPSGKSGGGGFRGGGGGFRGGGGFGGGGGRSW